MPSNRTRRSRNKIEDLSPAERAWLTGRNVHDLTGFGEFFYKRLTDGMHSTWRGKNRSPRWLIEQFPRLIPEDRRELLEQHVAAMEAYKRSILGHGEG